MPAGAYVHMCFWVCHNNEERGREFERKQDGPMRVGLEGEKEMMVLYYNLEKYHAS